MVLAIEVPIFDGVDAETFDHDVSCAFCRESLEGTLVGAITEHFVFEYDGELDYVELAHSACLFTFGEDDGTNLLWQ